METMDLSSGVDSVSLNSQPSNKPPQGPAVPQGLQYNHQEKNNTIEQQQRPMDSTPINDIMSGPEIMDPQDPRMMMAAAPPQRAAAVPVQPQMMIPQQQQYAQQPLPNKYPMNLTEEQVEALFVGLIAAVAFSKPIQDKMVNFIPQLVNENGHRSNVGIVATGLVAAGLFYFGRRIVIKP
jgi:hypothetical protein